jgi:hypothetical protein
VLSYALKDSFQSLHRAAPNSDSAAYAQIRVWFDSTDAGEPVPQTFNFLIRQSSGPPVERYEPHRAWQLQHYQPILKGHSNKDIARK